MIARRARGRGDARLVERLLAQRCGKDAREVAAAAAAALVVSRSRAHLLLLLWELRHGQALAGRRGDGLLRLSAIAPRGERGDE